MKKEWLDGVARDFVALGGIPFFILIIGRILILDTPEYLMQIVFGGVIFLLLHFLLKTDFHAGLSFVAGVFVIWFYSDWRFSVLASVIYLLIIGSLFYSKVDWKKIVKGILVGGVSVAVSFYLVSLMFG